MLYLSTIYPHTLGLLKQIMAIDALKDFRLVGGTALALQIGHRVSVDLDLFGQTQLTGEDIQFHLAEFEGIRPMSSSKSINIMSIQGVKVDFVNYRYPFL
jgi:Nucleotidyl transferase AbiEii toxin, Type IV TA system